MNADSIATRLHVDAPLSAGTKLGLDHQQAHFLRSVLRLDRGARLAVFNARDGEWLAVLEGLGKGWASLEVVSQRRQPVAERDIWLVFAPIKRARLDFMIEKASELGATRLQPVMTRHTVVGRVNTERLAANAREASEQCERLAVPEVGAVIDLADLLADWPGERRVLLCRESGAAQPIAEALSAARQSDPAAATAPWALFIGPEGGFHSCELDALDKLPFVTSVGLGPRILRADTAAIAALACWQAWLGDWHDRPPDR